jgi:hypothetical protein
MAIVRYLACDVDAAANENVTGPGGKQIVLGDCDGYPVELFEARQ